MHSYVVSKIVRSVIWSRKTRENASQIYPHLLCTRVQKIRRLSKSSHERFLESVILLNHQIQDIVFCRCNPILFSCCLNPPFIYTLWAWMGSVSLLSFYEYAVDMKMPFQKGTKCLHNNFCVFFCYIIHHIAGNQWKTKVVDIFNDKNGNCEYVSC